MDVEISPAFLGEKVDVVGYKHLHAVLTWIGSGPGRLPLRTKMWARKGT